MSSPRVSQARALSISGVGATKAAAGAGARRRVFSVQPHHLSEPQSPCTASCPGLSHGPEEQSPRGLQRLACVEGFLLFSVSPKCQAGQLAHRKQHTHLFLINPNGKVGAVTG